eukprot:Opistho-1_new@3965
MYRGLPEPKKRAQAKEGGDELRQMPAQTSGAHANTRHACATPPRTRAVQESAALRQARSLSGCIRSSRRLFPRLFLLHVDVKLVHAAQAWYVDLGERRKRRANRLVEGQRERADEERLCAGLGHCLSVHSRRERKALHNLAVTLPEELVVEALCPLVAHVGRPRLVRHIARLDEKLHHLRRSKQSLAVFVVQREALRVRLLHLAHLVKVQRHVRRQNVALDHRENFLARLGVKKVEHVALGPIENLARDCDVHALERGRRVLDIEIRPSVLVVPVVEPHVADVVRDARDHHRENIEVRKGLSEVAVENDRVHHLRDIEGVPPAVIRHVLVRVVARPHRLQKAPKLGAAEAQRIHEPEAVVEHNLEERRKLLPREQHRVVVDRLELFRQRVRSRVQMHTAVGAVVKRPCTLR